MRLVFAALILAGTIAVPAFAQAPSSPGTPLAPAAPPPAAAPAPAATPAPPAPVASQSTDEPTLEERRMVAYVATGVSVVSLGTGITFGILAQSEFNCAKDVINCNKTLQNKIVGAELFDVRSEIEQKALAADMSYLFAIASGVVATAGYLAGFVFVDEASATTSITPPVVNPIRLADLKQTPAVAPVAAASSAARSVANNAGVTR